MPFLLCIDKYLYKTEFQDIRYQESYIIPYNNDAWTIFIMIKDEEFMRNKVQETFGDKLVSLKAKSFFDDYYIKENDVYTYILYMPYFTKNSNYKYLYKFLFN